MQLQNLLSYVRRGVDDYQMIEEGDKIAVAISGGKDSLSLLVALHHLRRFYPRAYTLEAITVHLGLPGFDLAGIEALCRDLGVPYSVVETDIGPIIFEERKEKNPCSLCSKMRKGALNQEARRLGCNKIALGHNQDDVLETFFMSLFYEGRLHTFSPVSYLDRTELTLMRPLLYVPEKEVLSFSQGMGLPVVKSPCPVDGRTKREEIKQFIAHQAFGTNFQAKVFGAIQRAGINNWKKQPRRTSPHGQELS